MRAADQENVFRQWMEDHKGVILKVVRANASNPADQDDLFQEITFQVWRSVPSFQQRSKASTWIYKIALNTSMVWHRGERKHRGKRESLNLETEHPDSSSDPSRSLENRERLEWLYGELRRLPRSTGLSLCSTSTNSAIRRSPRSWGFRQATWA